MPCPVGVNIPRIFSLFNNYGIHKDLDKFKAQIAKLEQNELPNNCIKCGKCVKACPQGIQIFKQLEKINNIVNG
jgi:predicted aldo/keto reductase-like oxidoreductase